MRFATRVLTSGSLTLNAIDGASFVSVITDSTSSCTFFGNLPFKNVASDAITVTGFGFNLTSPTPTSPLDGIVITWVSGTVNIIIGV